MHPLENISWHTLVRPARAYSVRHGRGAPLRARLLADRRFRRFRAARLRRAARLLRAGRALLLRRLVRRGARRLDTSMPNPLCSRMVWDAPPATTTRPRRCGSGPARAAGARARHAHPPRTVRRAHAELGEYFGYFEGGRLVAMAGERMAPPGRARSAASAPIRISRAAGRARRLMLKLSSRQLQRGETPFLHVMRTTTTRTRSMCAWDSPTITRPSCGLSASPW